MKNYQQTSLERLFSRINLHVHNMRSHRQITDLTATYPATDMERTQKLYLLPKIHKNPRFLGRPIVLGSGGPKEKIPICRLLHQPTSTTHIIDIINHITDLPHAVLCTQDVSSLYNNIPHKEGNKTIHEALALYRSPTAMPYKFHNRFTHYCTRA